MIRTAHWAQYMPIDPDGLDELQGIVDSLENCLGRMQELDLHHPIFQEVFLRCSEATDRLDELVAHFSADDRVGQC